MATLAALIKDLAVLVGAVELEGVATAGSTTTLTDNITLGGYADDTFNNLRLYIYEGTALGQDRRITDHTGSTGILTFPTGTAPTTSSKYIILKDGWNPLRLRTALINALRQRRRFLLKPKVDESLTILTGPTYAYTVPTGFAAIQKVYREDTVGGGLFTSPIPEDYWYINRAATRQIVFEKVAQDRDPFLLTGAKLRLIGQAYETEPTADSDTITVQMGSLILFAAVTALLSTLAMDPTNARRATAQASMLLQEFQRTWQQDVTPIWPNSKVVDE